MVFNGTFNNISAMSWGEQVTFQWADDDVFVLDQYVLSDFYSAISLNKQSMGRRHASPLWHNILNLSQTVFALTP